MKVLNLIVVQLYFSIPLLADNHDIEFDNQVDFSKFKTFTIREGQITSKQPELNSTLVRKKIEEAVRSQLKSKHLEETDNRPDLFVTYRLGATGGRKVQAFPVGPRGLGTRRRTVRFTEGTLVIDLRDGGSRSLVWRGVYRDDESTAAKISEKLPEDVKKLFSEYPPKKKK